MTQDVSFSPPRIIRLQRPRYSFFQEVLVEVKDALLSAVYGLEKLWIGSYVRHSPDAKEPQLLLEVVAALGDACSQLRGIE